MTTNYFPETGEIFNPVTEHDQPRPETFQSTVESANSRLYALARNSYQIRVSLKNCLNQVGGKENFVKIVLKLTKSTRMHQIYP